MKRMQMSALAGCVAAAGLIMVGAGDGTKDSTKAKLGLAIGEPAPRVAFQTIEGESVTLESLHAQGPIVLTFYRGGWCPYCTKALAAWETKLPELTSAGGTLIAITLEKPDQIEPVQTKHAPNITILGDPTASAAKAFGLLFTVDAETQKRYKGYGIDVAAVNANGQWTLPHPGTFVIDESGVIRWAWVDEDYTKRADPKAVIAAVKAVTAAKK